MLLTFILFSTIVFGKEINVDTTNGLFKDSFGRYRIFHGVNAVYKSYPFHPQIEGFDANNSLSSIDMYNLKSFGMNIIRLHVAWEGVQPKRGQYNYSYIESLRTIIRNCREHDIYVLLDSHQDIYSRKFCGEGFPDWVVARTDFPNPLPFKLRYDEKGYPLLQDCLKFQFGLFYSSFDVMRFQNDFFTNVGKNADKFAQMWATVASNLGIQPNLLGYEILNQPIGGNFWKNPITFYQPQRNDNRIMLPFYRKVYKQIRKYDKDSLIVFESDASDILSGGFIQTPGGENQLHKQVYSFHVYCPSGIKSGEPNLLLFCKYFDKQQIHSKIKNAKNMKIGRILTQFGATSNSNKSADQIIQVTGDAQKHFNSWIYWQFKYFNDLTTAVSPGTTESFYNTDGTLQQNKVKALSHPYAYAICGSPLSQKWQQTSFQLSFIPFDCSGKNTQIYLNQIFYFQQGIIFQTKPTCSKCKLNKISHGYYEFQVPKLQQNKMIKLIIKVK